MTTSFASRRTPYFGRRTRKFARERLGGPGAIHSYNQRTRKGNDHQIQKCVAALTVAAAATVLATASSASAANEQFDAVGELAGPGSECDDPMSVFTIEISGGLEGCWYTAWFETTVATPSGSYQEVGAEWFVGCLVEDGVDIACGTFETTYRFTAKFTEDGQQHGRCQHPIVKGSGTGDFAGATGRVDFKDIIELGNFDLRGHIGLAG